MTTPLQSLIATGTKLWLDSVDPDLVVKNRALGVTGATSNPIIISDLIKTGRFNAQIAQHAAEGLTDDEIAWKVTDYLVRNAQSVFEPVSKETKCDDGWVSFELDPLLEDPKCTLTTEERSAKYIELGKKWAAGHTNRMIKVPATPGGLGALEELAAAGVALNVTLIFSERQYIAARDACWRGIQRRGTNTAYKTVYSIFVSRVDTYTLNNVKDLIPEAQGQVGLVNAKRLWKLNQDFWAGKGAQLKQEIIFASTGRKQKTDPHWKYVAALAGSDIQTNPPATNDAVQNTPAGETPPPMPFTRQVDVLPPKHVLDDIDAKVDPKKMEEFLMNEGLEKFAVPQHELIAVVAKVRASL